MLNSITIMGRMTKDPVLNYTNSSIPVCSFTLAVERDFADKQTGARETDFIECVAWRQTAEFVSRNFVKGQLTAVQGSLWLRDWTTKDGEKRRSAEIQVGHVYFAGPRDANRPAGRAEDVQGGFAELDDEDDGELPF